MVGHKTEVLYPTKHSCCQRQLAAGGDEEDRTLDLTDANRTLSQLSYTPEYMLQ